jgi:aspartyl-tRNA(Asn)/glutamyl-tRNA(Gln) amidotransferase subunit C
MPSKLTREDVLRVAELARLRLTDDEVTRFSEQINDILGYAGQVQEVDTTGVPPTSHVLGVAPAWRADEPRPSLDRPNALGNAPEADRSAGLFKVPKVL